MAHVSYADAGYYFAEYNGNMISEENLEKALKQASRHIDTLTYNRIVSRDISELTEFQQDIIKECCCEIADFEYENAEILQSILQSYSINGVSMSFGDSWNVKVISGVAVKTDIYEKLKQTGLCCMSLGRW